MQSMVLMGSEQVQRAGREISDAAEQMSRVANWIDESIKRLERALDEHASRVERAMSEGAGCPWGGQENES